MAQKKPKVNRGVKKELHPTITYRNEHQRLYAESIRSNSVTISIGPAGTGKTHIATALALDFLLHRRVERIIMTRPVVESGEHLGFLPGSADSKLTPYIRPIMDEMLRIMPLEKVAEWKSEKKIEVVPFAFMRGLNFHDCFIIMDEAQNATEEQLRMLLTRLGMNSKLVINGDLTQEDLPVRLRGGLDMIASALENVPDIGVVEFYETDIVRNPLISVMLKAIRDYLGEE